MPRRSTSTVAPGLDVSGRPSRRSFLGFAGKAGAMGAAATVASVAAPIASAAAATAAGTALGYAQTVSAASTSSSTSAPNLTLSVTISDAPIAVEYGGYVSSTATNGLVKLYLLRDGKAVHELGATVAGTNGVTYLSGTCRIPPTRVGSTVFSVLVANWSSGATAKLLANPMSPAFILVRAL